MCLDKKAHTDDFIQSVSLFKIWSLSLSLSLSLHGYGQTLAILKKRNQKNRPYICMYMCTTLVLYTFRFGSVMFDQHSIIRSAER